MSSLIEYPLVRSDKQVMCEQYIVPREMLMIHKAVALLHSILENFCRSVTHRESVRSAATSVSDDDTSMLEIELVLWSQMIEEEFPFVRWSIFSARHHTS